MADSFLLSILSPDRPFYVGPCVSLILPIGDGSLGIMAHHTPLTAAVMDGEVRFTTPDGKTTLCAIGRGMVDVSRTDVKLLCDSVVLPEEIDEVREQQALEMATADLRRKQGQKDYMLTKLAVSNAVNHLRIKKRQSGTHND